MAEIPDRHTEESSHASFANTSRLTEQLQTESLQIPCEARELTDTDGFVRKEFVLNRDSGVSVVFRDPEELPELAKDERMVVSVISPYDAPVRTSRDSYGEWLGINTQGDIDADPFERAVEHGAEAIRFFVPSTPHGVVTAAMELAEKGVLPVTSEKLEQLRLIKKSIENRDINPDVLELYDQLYAATAVTLRDGEATRPDEYSWSNPNQEGLMEVLLALTGDEVAKRIVTTKQHFVSVMDESVAQRRYDERTGKEGQEKAPFKQPGELLSDQEIDLIASKHFVAVHTSPVAPYHIGGGSDGPSVIRPTSEFGVQGDAPFPRNTLHWSLNHPVESHLYGNFGGRPYTVVAPLEDIARMNGAPAVLYGVDSYYALNPGDGLLVPDSAHVIEMTDDDHVQGIDQLGNRIRIKDQDLTSSDTHRVVEYIGQNYVTEVPSYLGADEAALQYLESYLMLHGSELSTMVSIGLNNYYHPREEIDLIQYPMLESEVAANRLNDEFMDLLNTYSVVEGKVYAELSEADRKKTVHEMIKAVFTQQGVIERYPQLHPVIVESLRQAITKMEIRRLGGKLVQSDGMSAYIEDSAFSSDVEEVAQKIGLRTGLHQYQPEREFEQAYTDAINRSTRTVPVPREIAQANPDYPAREQADFSWQDYTDEATGLWQILEDSSWATRRMAIHMGLLPHAHKVRTSYTPSGSIL